MTGHYAYTIGERLLTIANVCVRYDRPILEGVSGHIDNLRREGLNQGQVVCLLGPSGIGKSQLFRCIAGLHSNYTGDISLGGERLPESARGRSSLARKQIQYVFQNPYASLDPMYSVAQIIGYMKGKSSIWIAQNVERKMRNFLGHKFWARGYFVTTVGRDEEMIRAYIKNQEMADQQLDQMELKISATPKSNQPS